MSRPVLAAAIAAVALLSAPLAQASIVHYVANLSGTAESPPNASPGTGFALVDYDSVLHTLHVAVSFTGLTGNTTASHIHCCTAVADVGNVGVATELPTFANLPLGVAAGSFVEDYDLTLATSWNPAFITGHGGTITTAEAAFASGLAAEKAYLNIHTTFRPGGEIRGFLQVPEPSSLALMVLALTGLGASSRVRRK